MKKAKLKTYLYLIIIMIVIIFIHQICMKIILYTTPLTYFFIFLLNYVLYIVLMYLSIINLLADWYLYIELDPKKSIFFGEKLYKFFKINILKDIYRLNLSASYWLLNDKEKAMKYFNEIKIKKFILPIIKYCYYANLVEYKYFMGEKEEARKIFEEHFRKSKEKMEIGILLDYENNLEKKIFELEKLLNTKKRKLSKIQIKFNLAKSYEEIGNIDKAKRLYKEISEKGSKLYIGEISNKKLLKL